MNNAYSQLLIQAKNPLVLAVGGGNDSVSTLLIQKQLQKSFGYQPKKINVVAMLPDCLDYEGTSPTEHPLVHIITENSQRYVQGKLMPQFPERILSMNKNAISGLIVENVYGLLMTQGSIGITEALEYVFSTQEFDLILAMDVGGDFIAVPENIEVLSPMMDAYMMYALKYLQANNKKFQDTPIIYGVFGLGTDGETTPELLYEALDKVEPFEDSFHEEDVIEVINFYRQTVEPNRYSRTTDFTMKEIQGIAHDNPAPFRGRFHVKTKNGEKSQVNYGDFQHYQDPYFFGKYYLFTDVSKVQNPFAIACSNGIEWFVNIQSQSKKINHELNGQCYDLSGTLEGVDKGTLMFFGTPSRKFNENQQKEIAQQIALSIENGVYNLALVYKEQQEQFSNNKMNIRYINDEFMLVAKNTLLSNENTILLDKAEALLKKYLGKSVVNDYHKEMLRKWLSKESVLKNFMSHFPQKDNPQTDIESKEFKYISYAAGLNYSGGAMIELYQFLRDEGHLYYDGRILYSLV
jgi:hypothetical protein